MPDPKPYIVAIIPARGGSKSIPGKNIKELGGYPLIAYSIAAGLESELADRVIVSTDDDEIAAVAKRFGAEVPFMRPSELALDQTADLPVFQHALEYMRTVEARMPDVVVHLRPTSPFRPSQCVDEAVRILLKDPAADSVRSVVPAGQNPYKMWYLESDAMVPLIDTQLEEAYNMPRQLLPAVYWHAGHIDAIRTRTVIDQNSMTGKRILPCIIDPVFAVDLDTPEDWRFAEFLVENRKLDRVHPRPDRGIQASAVKLVLFDFDGVFTDNKVYVREDGTETVVCSRADGMGIERLKAAGIDCMVLSGENNPVVAARCRKLNVSCTQSVIDKGQAIEEIAAEKGVPLEEICFVGNDLNDLDAMEKAGFAVAVHDADPAVRRAADLVLKKAGGNGAVRELCEKLIEENHPVRSQS